MIGGKELRAKMLNLRIEEPSLKFRQTEIEIH